jgi:exopolyphosphatase/pppGpp-phosphohydrolase
MDLFELPELEVCPWALREGVILRRLDTLPASLPCPAGKPAADTPPARS